MGLSAWFGVYGYGGAGGAALMNWLWSNGGRRDHTDRHFGEDGGEDDEGDGDDDDDVSDYKDKKQWGGTTLNGKIRTKRLKQKNTKR